MAKNRDKESKSLKEQFAALGNLRPFFQLIWQTDKRLALGNMMLRLVKSVIPLLMLYVGKEIIDEVVRLIDLSDPMSEARYLWTLLGIELGLAIFSDLISRGIALTETLLGDLFANNTSMKLIEHAAKLDMYQFENPVFYDKLERARRQTTGRTALMSQTLQQFQDIITILFLGAGLVFFNPWLILILIIAVIPAFLGETYFNQKVYSLTRAWTPQRRELDYLRYIGASDTTAKEVKVFNLSDFLAKRFYHLADQYYKENRKIAIQRTFIGSLLAVVGTFAYYLAYVVIAVQTINGAITLGTLTFLTGSFSRMRNMLQGIMGRFSRITDSAMYLQDLFDFFDIQPTIISKKESKPFPATIQQGFTFENVGFKYPGTDQWAIRHLSFHINPGEKMALVGENGAGKTTLVKLLARLYEPTEGRILVDGIDLRDIELDTLRNNVGIIFQDFVRFQLKVRENIAIGSIDQVDNMEPIETAAQKSLIIDNIINKQPTIFCIK